MRRWIKTKKQPVLLLVLTFSPSPMNVSLIATRLFEFFENCLRTTCGMKSDFRLSNLLKKSMRNTPKIQCSIPCWNYISMRVLKTWTQLSWLAWKWGALWQVLRDLFWFTWPIVLIAICLLVWNNHKFSFFLVLDLSLLRTG